MIGDLLQVFYDSLKKTDFKPYIGDTNYDKSTYPLAQVFPENSSYNTGGEYEDTYTVFFVFEKGNKRSNKKRTSEYIENINIVESAIDTIQDDLSDTGLIHGFIVQNIDFLVAENSENLLDVIRVDWNISKLKELCYNE